MGKWIEKIEYVGINSPEYYNFTNDKIDCIIRINKKEVQKFIYENKPAFEKYLIDNFKSRDGFMSFHSYSFNDWEEMTKKFTDFSNYSKGYIQLGSVLDFIADTQDETEINTETLYYGAEDVHISNYYTDEFFEIVNGTEEIKKFVKDNYRDLSIREITFEKFTNEDAEERFNNLGHDKIKSAINEAISEIEKQTIELIF